MAIEKNFLVSIPDVSICLGGLIHTAIYWMMYWFNHWFNKQKGGKKYEEELKKTLRS